MLEKEKNLYNEKISFLKRYFWIVVNLIDELTDRYSDSFIKASQLTGMPKGKAISTIDDIYFGLLNEKKNIDKNITILYRKKKEIEKAVNDIDDPNLRYVIKSKYLRFQTIEKIAERLEKSTKQISRWHSDGINDLVLPEDYKF